MNNPIDRLLGTNTLVIVLKFKVICAPYDSRKLTSVFPCEDVGFAVVVAKGIADCVIGETYPSVRGQLIAPVGIGIAIVVCRWSW